MVGDYKSEVAMYIIPEVLCFYKSQQRYFSLHGQAGSKLFRGMCTQEHHLQHLEPCCASYSPGLLKMQLPLQTQILLCALLCCFDCQNLLSFKEFKKLRLTYVLM